MTKKSEVSEKLFIYKKPKKRNNFLEYLAITQKEFPKTLKNFLSLIFGYLYKNGIEETSCGEKWLLKRILHAAGIYY